MISYITVARSAISTIGILLVLLTGEESYGEQFGKQVTSKPIFLDIPGQSLNSALLELALQANVEILAESTALENRRSIPLIGLHSPEYAIKKVLQKNTSLNAKSLGKNSWIVYEQPPTPKSSVSNQKSDVASEIFIEEVRVTSARLPFRYTTISESSELAGNMSVFDSSRFINVLPQQLIIDQVPPDLTDFLKHTSGITPGDGLADSNDDFYIRGFKRDAVYLDRFRINSNTGIKISPVNIEKVETLKGPSTLFYGQAEPGGTVNIIRKSPQSEKLKQIQFRSGSLGQRETSIDITGPVDENLLYRMLYARQTFDTQRNLSEVKRESFASSLQANLSKNTNLELRFDHNKTSNIIDQGLLAILPDAESIKIIAIDSNQPTRQAQENFYAGQNIMELEVSHILRSNWSLQGKYTQFHERRRGIRTQNNLATLTGLLGVGDELSPNTELRELTGTTLDGRSTTISVPVSVGTEIISDDTRTVGRVLSIYDERAQNKTQFFQIVAGGTESIFSLPHHIDAGIEFYKENIFETLVLEDRNDITSLFFDALGGQGESDNADTLGELSDRQQRFLLEEFGAYLQNSVELNDKWITSLGGRYTITKGKRSATESPEIKKFQRYEEFSSQFGLVYKVSDYMSLYGNYSESMKANYQVDDVGTVIPKPELSDQIEVGVKLLFGGRLSAGLALFDIDKKNIVNVDFDNGIRRSRLGGKQNIQGIDLDISFRATEHTNIIGAASWLDASIVSGTNVGNTPALAAKSTASLFLNHSFGSSKNEGFSANIGAYYVGDRYGDEKNEVFITDHALIDLGLRYKLASNNRKYDFDIRIRNATDENYIASVESGLRINNGGGRLVSVSVKTSF